MWAVYLCGATDCFLHAMFVDQDDADQWLKDNSHNPEGGYVELWKTPTEIDTSDTGWNRYMIKV